MSEVRIRFCRSTYETATNIVRRHRLCIFDHRSWPVEQSIRFSSIDAYCTPIEKMTNKSKTPLIVVFADTSNYAVKNPEPKWQKFASEKALEKFRDKAVTYSIAYNWRRNGKIVASNFTNSSESGDWAMYIDHCSRGRHAGTRHFRTADVLWRLHNNADALLFRAR